jgi:hypothetical protein
MYTQTQAKGWMDSGTSLSETGIDKIIERELTYLKLGFPIKTCFILNRCLVPLGLTIFERKKIIFLKSCH